MQITIKFQRLLLASVSTACTLHNDCNEELIFVDEFNELNTRRWKHELFTICQITLSGGGNWEFQYNFMEQILQRTDLLSIFPVVIPMNVPTMVARTTNGGNYVNPITSACISTIKSFSFR
jgi:hypothetical protein